MIKYFSQSMTNTFSRCAEQFRRRYIEREIIPPGITARKGSATHKAAEINHEQKIITGQDLPLDVIQDAARDEYVYLVKDRGVFIPREDVSEKTRLLGEGLDSAVRLATLYREEIAPAIQPTAVEVKFFHEVKGLDIPLMGILDLICGDTYHDFKTSGKSGNQSTADNSIQLTFYWGLARANDFPIDNLALEVLVDNSKTYHQTFKTTRNQGDFNALVARIKVIMASIRAGLFPPCDPSSWQHSPRWCGYYWTCRYAQEGKRIYSHA